MTDGNCGILEKCVCVCVCVCMRERVKQNNEKNTRARTKRDNGNLGNSFNVPESSEKFMIYI